jgi:CO dehydrogenase/acetyl-CoA synthase beta subunit
VPERVIRKREDLRRPVADYVKPVWAKWLQTKRIELNAMTTPQFLKWLDDKMEKFGRGKLIPPELILAKELHRKVREKLEENIKDRILKEQDAKGQIEREFEKLEPVLNEKAKDLAKDVTEDMAKKPEESWRDPVLKVAHDLVERSVCS